MHIYIYKILESNTPLLQLYNERKYPPPIVHFLCRWYSVLHAVFLCLMCRRFHVLCVGFCMYYVNFSPNGLASLRRARFARFASVQRPLGS